MSTDMADLTYNRIKPELVKHVFELLLQDGTEDAAAAIARAVPADEDDGDVDGREGAVEVAEAFEVAVGEFVRVEPVEAEAEVVHEVVHEWLRGAVVEVRGAVAREVEKIGEEEEAVVVVFGEMSGGY